MLNADTRTGSFAAFRLAFDNQRHVIGALMMRELHTRYGRENIGYLWVIVEPMLLAGAVAAIHVGERTHYASDIRSVPFAILGYCIFILFRSIITRAESTIDSNKALLFHRMVTIYDMLTARALIEGASTVCTLGILILFATVLGFADLPVRPVALVGAIFFMLWLSFGLSMLLAAVSYDNKLVTKFIHPVTYLLMPASGAFFQVQWLPEPYRTWLSWFPLTQIFELARYGQFESATLTYVDFPYLIGTNLFLLFIGLLALKAVRRSVHL
ncbi:MULTISPECIES: ABC transporter permease [Sphingomonas]|jgi:capsular polysaccharide transport system permease protein|uniref:ABC transporter permease n=2 Tax=Pseudomonadota TaxID=1224 RepID=UPI001AE741C0